MLYIKLYIKYKIRLKSQSVSPVRKHLLPSAGHKQLKLFTEIEHKTPKIMFLCLKVAGYLTIY